MIVDCNILLHFAIIYNTSNCYHYLYLPKNPFNLQKYYIETGNNTSLFVTISLVQIPC